MTVPGRNPLLLAAGDIVLLHRTAAYALAEEQKSGSSAPTGTSSTLPQLLTGAYRDADQVGQRLLSLLPPLIHLPANESLRPVLALFADIARGDDPDTQPERDRLLDLLLTRGLRIWFAGQDSEPGSWLSALADPIIGPVLRVLHEHPACPWTITMLAAQAGVSRATLTRRFTERVGHPPLTTLTHIRMGRASELLRTTDATVTAVARHVGYLDPFAFSTAFKRVCGVTPSTHRAG